ncbi:hypothetical protein [Alkalibacterium sp. 20]|uniref:hypothetical protein n=1 Tax=Alkalibacterium sp. 20 TaxID=1798803 RepID=UPI0008FFF284|nr:hypothetical protein [Alkalibacterium sp. 20]OJF93913.1 hypothetical protein AX762_08300 [Alkalibacterium sp. 20]
MNDQPYSARNPNLPVDAAAYKNVKGGLPKAEDEVEKTETEKEQDTAPEDKKPFNLDKVDALKKAKEETSDTKDN